MSGDHNKYCSANNPKDGWIELTTLQDVAKAQADGWEIEANWDSTDDGWTAWLGKLWQDDLSFRARPRQPKMKKVRMQCWLTKVGFLEWVEDGSEGGARGAGWIRIPAQDIEIEIPEGV